MENPKQDTISNTLEIRFDHSQDTTPAQSINSSKTKSFEDEVSPPSTPETLDLESQSQAQSPPYHVFSRARKKQMVYLVSFAALFSPLSSNIYFPALGEVARVRDIPSFLAINDFE